MRFATCLHRVPSSRLGYSEAPVEHIHPQTALEMPQTTSSYSESSKVATLDQSSDPKQAYDGDRLTLDELKARYPVLYDYNLSLSLLEHQKRKRAILERGRPGYVQSFSSRSTTGSREGCAYPASQQSSSSEGHADADWLSTDVLYTFDFEAFLRNDRATAAGVEQARNRDDNRFSASTQCNSEKSREPHDDGERENAASDLEIDTTEQ